MDIKSKRVGRIKMNVNQGDCKKKKLLNSEILLTKEQREVEWSTKY